MFRYNCPLYEEMIGTGTSLVVTPPGPLLSQEGEE